MLKLCEIINWRLPSESSAAQIADKTKNYPQYQKLTKATFCIFYFFLFWFPNYRNLFSLLQPRRTRRTCSCTRSRCRRTTSCGTASSAESIRSYLRWAPGWWWRCWYTSQLQWSDLAKLLVRPICLRMIRKILLLNTVQAFNHWWLPTFLSCLAFPRPEFMQKYSHIPQDNFTLVINVIEGEF